ncbi:MAG: PSD1 domain-containing protein [Phycisphaerae bacterium]|nr:PSD1 domain-containing protein [Phycisphaerae bacterium]
MIDAPRRIAATLGDSSNHDDPRHFTPPFASRSVYRGAALGGMLARMRRKGGHSPGFYDAAAAALCSALAHAIASTSALPLLSSLAAAPVIAAGPPGTIDFDRDIRPILSDSCFACHGPDAGTRKARLRLDTREGLFGPTRDAADENRDPFFPSRVVAPGDVAMSELARRVMSEDEDERMPPAEWARQLTAEELAKLREWIDDGAPWSGHWAYEPVKPVAVPDARDGAACRNEIDRFVLTRLEREKDGPLGLSEEADRATLIRRLSLDLTGLPPSREEVAAFENDSTPDAYERAVDRLLASARFGEHFAGAWLDAARYADSNGFQIDPDRTAWPWRDWVIQAFNSNMPYDRFVFDQVAGDLVPGAGAAQILATAFNRNHPINGEGGRDVEESRIDYVHDRVDATSTAFLGITLSCAQCHDHKYDPFTQRDYYRFFAFFNSIDETGGGEQGDMPPLLDWKAADGRDLKVMVMRDRAEPRRTHMLLRGAWDQPGQEVVPGTPDAITPEAAAASDDASRGATAALSNRLALAAWLTSRDNPLTPRVAVNRLWQHLFGHGLVRTPDNFGVQGERPTHPELLDWLAGRFMESGWDVKALLKLIVSSATYRQTSVCSKDLLDRDPENRLLARSPRYRLAAGVLRDQALFASGLLVETLGGPPVKPYHPAGVWEDVSFGRIKYEPGKGHDLYRRSVYTFWRRTAAPVNLFDVPQRQKCSVRVIRTNTPLQSLVLLNDVTFAEASAALGQRAMHEGGTDDRTRLSWAIETVLSRRPTEHELDVLASRLGRLRDHYASHPGEARDAACAGDRPDPAPDRFTDIAAYAGVMSIILNLDETLTRE